MKRVIKVIFALFIALGLMTAMSACGASAPSANQQDQKTSADILRKMQQAQPAPEFDYSQIRQTAIDAETAQANATQTTSFFFNLGVQDPVFVCPSIGFPVPGTDQITNPQQLTWNYLGNGNGYAEGAIPQIDPNGVYGGDTSATLVLCVNGQGKVYLHHAEEHVHTIAGPAVWNMKLHRIEITGDPTFKPKVGK